jgi:pantoate--beta-alanine ligase
MKNISDITEMTHYAEKLADKGDRIGFVPTMGFLHEGHLSLMRKAREENHTLVVSIFVNPTQFGPNEDLESYPRDLESDMELCREVGCDVLFTPEPAAMYPAMFKTTVSVSGVTEALCGASRPGHFDGVTTVVAKLFNIVRPHRAYFGLKDYQQYRVIERMTHDLDMDIRIIGLPTIREDDGLAMSSRNTYLTQAERVSALSLSRSLEMASSMVREGTQDASRIAGAVTGMIEDMPHTRIDYVKCVDALEMTPVAEIEKDTLLALAVFVGKARLIDNVVLTPPAEDV